ncbi:unknown [Feldmannia species virus]|uniref:Uncharacterized protein n=1 Tax=Feldmannia species virus TaxID=39420 RepID=B5LWG2_9PHYC|nr:hypothetical protein FeldSpV_gp073 [Feldmannia species virus]ACH46825.1 unknown [Feldmannia species virus]
MLIPKCLSLCQPVRKKIFGLAERNCAIASTPVASESITYEEEDLRVRLVFPTQDRAIGFANLLGDNLVGYSEGDIRHSFEPCDVPEDPVMVKVSHYVEDESDSPPNPSSVSIATTSFSTMFCNDEDIRFQMIEDPGLLHMGRPDKCHLVDKALCDEVGICKKRDHNNILCCMPTTHRMLDGVPGQSPVIRIEPVEIVESDKVMDSAGVSRTACKLKIHFRELIIAKFSTLRLNSSSRMIDETTYETFVYMVDPELFVRCAAWKNKRTLEMWDC